MKESKVYCLSITSNSLSQKLLQAIHIHVPELVERDFLIRFQFRAINEGCSVVVLIERLNTFLQKVVPHRPEGMRCSQ